jgi:hypothetical protein
MIVAIIKQLSGIVPVEEFREDIDEASAVDAFCLEYAPPLNPLDYLGFDTGWSVFQPPAPLTRWGYDFGAPGLVQIPLTPTYDLKVSNKVVELLALAGIVFVELGGVVAAPALLGDPTKLIVRAVGLCRTTAVGAQVRISQNGVPISLDTALPATGGVWAPFIINTNAPLVAGLNVYTLEGLLGLAVLAELKYVSFNLLLSLD